MKPVPVTKQSEPARVIPVRVVVEAGNARAVLLAMPR
jgi:hypothetical protein